MKRQPAKKTGWRGPCCGDRYPECGERFDEAHLEAEIKKNLEVLGYGG